ncbi:MAG TPA: SH3 domain-containing protein [Usitatibacter sp.]
MRFPVYLALLFSFSAQGATPAGDLLMAAGMQRAEKSEVHWSVRDGTHPKLGPIKVAISIDAHISYIGTAKIVSTVYLSCVKKTGKIAIELTNARTVDLGGGLKAKEQPRVACLGVAPPGALAPRTEIAAKWEPNDLGDLMARDLSPAALRACTAIEIAENILLPPALGKDNVEFTVEVAPYARELDAVFSACGEVSAYAPGAQPAVVAEAKPAAPAPVIAAPVTAPAPVPVAPPPSVPAPAPSIPAPAPKAAPIATPTPVPVPPPAPTAAPAAPGTYQRAHTASHGRTNIRKSPDIASPVVAQIPPGVRVLVLESVDDWWHVKSPSGATFEGYIRRDRFTLD